MASEYAEPIATSKHLLEGCVIISLLLLLCAGCRRPPARSPYENSMEYALGRRSGYLTLTLRRVTPSTDRPDAYLRSPPILTLVMEGLPLPGSDRPEFALRTFKVRGAEAADEPGLYVRPPGIGSRPAPWVVESSYRDGVSTLRFLENQVGKQQREVLRLALTEDGTRLRIGDQPPVGLSSGPHETFWVSPEGRLRTPPETPSPRRSGTEPKAND
jgi:hypothetical protein